MSRPVIVMAAPNGARKTRRDHPGLPLSISQTVDEAELCFKAGASVLHAHVRGSEDQHILDAGLYRELLGELHRRVPDMMVQITSEAVGSYSPRQQVECIVEVNPDFASMALREVTSSFTQTRLAQEFFEWCEAHRVHLQHILYNPEDLDFYLRYRKQGVIPSSQNCVLFVLGRYSDNLESAPENLEPFLKRDLSGLIWFLCAFGRREQDCALSAIDTGGHARVGFENNLLRYDGSLAESTAEQIDDLAKKATDQGYRIATPAEAAALLSLRKV